MQLLQTEMSHAFIRIKMNLIVRALLLLILLIINISIHETIAQRSKPRVCYEVMDESNCTSNLEKLTRWFYDSKNDQCRTFTYHGCGDSANNFAFFEQCQRFCNPGNRN